jgi:hypothetical protein
MTCYNVVSEIKLGGEERSSMDANRTANRESDEIAPQYQSQQEPPLIEELTENKLRQSMVFIGWLEQTPPGIAELQRRTKLFGECERIGGETAGHFAARQCHWLERDMPKIKSPLHAPRQTIA